MMLLAPPGVVLDDASQSQSQQPQPLSEDELRVWHSTLISADHSLYRRIRVCNSFEGALGLLDCAFPSDSLSVSHPLLASLFFCYLSFSESCPC